MASAGDGGVFGGEVVAAPDPGAAGWIRPRLGELGTVGGLVPDGYERYVLVRPVHDNDEHDADVALTGALARLAERHTTTPGSVWYAIWDGYGFETSVSLYLVDGRGPGAWARKRYWARRGRALDRRRNEVVRRALAELPTFELPWRRYSLLHGSLSAAARIVAPTGWGHHAPDLWWPDDRSWFVATDTDLDWVYVGGSAALVDDVVAAFPGRCEPVERSSPSWHPPA